MKITPLHLALVAVVALVVGTAYGAKIPGLQHAKKLPGATL